MYVDEPPKDGNIPDFNISKIDICPFRAYQRSFRLFQSDFSTDIHQRSRLLCFTQNDHTGQTGFKICSFLKWAHTLSSVKDGFYAVQQFLTILYELSRCENARTLASSSYAKVAVEDDSRRILKVKNFISKNYMDELRLPELASLAGMSSSAFSRFFKLHTGRNISEYIIDLRLGYAARMLVDTAKSISEIGFDCGFNNLSNFNRIFKKKKGCSPSEFRESYHKTRIIV